METWLRTNAGGDDAILIKYDTVGNVLWQRQFGTSRYEHAYSVTVDQQDNVYFGGDIETGLVRTGSNAGPWSSTTRRGAYCGRGSLT